MWFWDRIEIQNPGGPYGQVTRANFGMPGITDYRNPHIAEAMKNLGYVQRFGVGISLARKESGPKRQSRARVRRRGQQRAGCGQEANMSVPVIAFFNNKGGVGKTSLVYHLAWMFADRGLRVLAADLDPQANLSAFFIDDDGLSLLWPEDESLDQTIFTAINPQRRGVGDVKKPHLEVIARTVGPNSRRYGTLPLRERSRRSLAKMSR